MAQWEWPETLRDRLMFAPLNRGRTWNKDTQESERKLQIPQKEVIVGKAKKAWPGQKEAIKVGFTVKLILPFGRWGPKRKTLCKFSAFVVFSFNACNYIVLYNDFPKQALQESNLRGGINDSGGRWEKLEKLIGEPYIFTSSCNIKQ